MEALNDELPMRQEGAAGPAATATRGVTMLLVRPHVTTALSSPVLETIWDNPSDAIFDTEDFMGKKKKRSKAAGKQAAKAKQEKKQPKKRK